LSLLFIRKYTFEILCYTSSTVGAEDAAALPSKSFFWAKIEELYQICFDLGEIWQN